ncbi:MAG: SsrA-binding protein SmpB [Marinilabiliaceae bacterium]|nr:SsrA-binding protein SmpB [Marinilabiliaceae bacterium]
MKKHFKTNNFNNLQNINGKKEMSNTINIKNKRAFFDFEILDRYDAGIQLCGTEIKSIRQGRVSLVDTYCMFYNRELWTKGMNIAEYSYGTYNNHIPTRERKLLLKKKELRKLERKIKESGLTIVPLRLFINDNGLAKLEIALAKGKKEYDKRETIKQKDTSREMDRIKKRY